MQVLTLNRMPQLNSINGSQLLLARRENRDYALPVSTILNKNKNILTLEDGNFAYSLKNSNGNLSLLEGSSKIGDLVINEKSFKDNTLLSFNNIFCPGVYTAWKQGYPPSPLDASSKALLHFGLTFPSFIDIKNNNSNLYLKSLTLRIRTSQGAAVLVTGHSSITATYTDISNNDINIISNKLITMDFEDAILPQTITNITPNAPNQFRITISLYNNLRYLEPVLGTSEGGYIPWTYETPTAENTREKLVQPNTTCIVTASGEIGYKESN